MQNNKPQNGLKIYMFGDFRVVFNNQTLLFPTRETQSLFAYLILNRDRCFDRSLIGEQFFPDLSFNNARKRLRNCIWRIRSVFESVGADSNSFLTISNRDIGFRSDCNYWLDIERFENVIEKKSPKVFKSLNEKSVVELQNCLTFYRGDLLESIDDQWCFWERERLKVLFLRGLEKLMNHHLDSAEWHRAIGVAIRIIGSDPLREHVYRNLMRSYYAIGDRPAALMEYQKCANILQKELDVLPMKSTQKLKLAIENETLEVPSIEGSAKASIETLSTNPIEKCLGDIDSLMVTLQSLSTELKRNI